MDIALTSNIIGYESFIKDLFFQYKTAELYAFTWPKELLVPLLEMQFQAQNTTYHQKFPNAQNYIILLSNMPIGWFLINKAETDHIINMIIQSKYQGQGIGSYVIKKLIQESGCENKKLTLQVSKTNKAFKLYSRLGFKISHTEDIFVSMSI